MPKNKSTRSALIRTWISDIQSYTTDGKIIFCQVCNKEMDHPENRHPLVMNQAVSAPTKLEYLCNLDYERKTEHPCLTGIIATIGPSTKDPEKVAKMVEYGASIMRINLSFGNYETFEEIIIHINKAMETRKYIARPFGVAIDLKGDEIRSGLIDGKLEGEVELIRGNEIKLTTEKAYELQSSANTVYVDYENITKVVGPGDRIFLGDGAVSVMVNNTGATVINCTVENSGILGSKKGVHLPGVALGMPILTNRDKQDIKWALLHDIDMVFASHVKDPHTINEIRNLFKEKEKNVLVLAKIANHQAMVHLDEFINISDGLIISRADLSITYPPEKVFLVEKVIISRCNKAGKPVIYSTKILESMITSPRPTRCECAVVANAVLEGVDSIMLSGETAIGSYPAESVLTLASVCREAESANWQLQLFNDLKSQIVLPIDAAQMTAIATVEAAAKCLASAIVAFTTSGRSARLIAKYRPHCPIITVTRSEKVARRLQVYRAIIPVVYREPYHSDWLMDVEGRISLAINYGSQMGYIKAGDAVIVETGWKQGPGYTNTIRMVYVSGDIKGSMIRKTQEELGHSSSEHSTSIETDSV